jgi:hypothetical protein
VTLRRMAERHAWRRIPIGFQLCWCWLFCGSRSQSVAGYSLPTVPNFVPTTKPYRVLHSVDHALLGLRK